MRALAAIVVLGAVVAADEVAEIRAAHKAALALYKQGEFARARAGFEKVVQRWEASQDPHKAFRAAVAVSWVAGCYEGEGDFEQAYRCRDDQVKRLRKLTGVTRTLVGALEARATMAHELRRYEDACRDSREALAIVKKVGAYERVETIHILRRLSGSLRAKGDLARAIECAREATVLTRRVRGVKPRLRAEIWSGYVSALIAGNRFSRDAMRAARINLKLTRQAFGEQSRQTATAVGFVAQCLVANGKAEEAVALYEQALAICRKDPRAHAPTIAYLLGESGNALSQCGRDLEALKRYRQGLALWRQVYGASDPGLVPALSNLADSQLDMHRWREGEQTAKEMLTLARKVHGERAAPTGMAYVVLGRAFSGRGDHAAGRAAIKKGASILERAHQGDHLAVANALSHAMIACLKAGDHDAARKYAERGLAMMRRLLGPRHARCAPLLVGLAKAKGARGEWTGAMEDLQEALRAQREVFPKGHSVMIWTLGEMGGLMLQTERYKLARPYYREAYAILRRYPHRIDDLAYVLEGLSRCHQHDRPSEAIACVKRAHALYRQIHAGDHYDVAVSLANVGITLMAVGRDADAIPYLEESLAMYRRLFPEGHPRATSNLGNLGLALANSGRPNAALPYLREATTRAPTEPNVWMMLGRALSLLKHDKEAGDCYRRAFEVQPDGPRAPIALMNSAAVLAEQDPKQAEQAARRALAMAGDRLPDHIRGSISAQLGIILCRQLRYAEAVPYLARAIEQFEEQRRRASGLTPQDRAVYFDSLSRGIYDAMVHAQVGARRPDEALRYLERGRARELLDLLERSRFDPLEQAERRARRRRDKAALERLANARGAVQSALLEVARLEHVKARPSQLAPARKALREALRERARLVRKLVPLAEPAKPEELQALLGPGERMLVYSTEASQTWLFVVRPAGQKVTFHHDKTPGRVGVRLDALVAEHRADVANAGGAARGMADRSKRAALRGAPHALFRALIPAALWQEIQKAPRIYIVPDGPLHALPFETLHIDKQGTTWLDAGPPLVYGASGSALLWCKRRRDEQTDEELPLPALVLADPDPMPAGLAALPGARHEAQAIQKTFGGKAKLLIGADARKPALLDLAPQARFLHLATHQVVEETGHETRTRMALAMPKAVSEQDDGFLRLRDLLEDWRDLLSGCELTVLSACETRRGTRLQNEGVFALPYGILYAGCPSIIASHWRVDDRSTAELFADFYARLAKGTPKLQAFTEARRALKKRYPQPYHWAPFVYIGDPR